jgi:hypothetical protein
VEQDGTTASAAHSGGLDRTGQDSLGACSKVDTDTTRQRGCPKALLDRDDRPRALLTNSVIKLKIDYLRGECVRVSVHARARGRVQ